MVRCTPRATVRDRLLLAGGGEHQQQEEGGGQQSKRVVHAGKIILN